jgi:hypothetical protein
MDLVLTTDGNLDKPHHTLQANSVLRLLVWGLGHWTIRSG